MNYQNSRKCATCKFFESRSGFCRKNPPQVIVNTDGYYVAAFPKIAFPLLDFCFDYVNMEIEENTKTLLT